MNAGKVDSDAVTLILRFGSAANLNIHLHCLVLEGAYRHHLGICPPLPRIRFDRAFDLAARTDGLWRSDTTSISLVTCQSRHSKFLAAYLSVARSHNHCPFSNLVLVQRYGIDPRVQGTVPVQPIAVAKISDLGMLRLMKTWDVQEQAPV